MQVQNKQHSEETNGIGQSGAYWTRTSVEKGTSMRESGTVFGLATRGAKYAAALGCLEPIPTIRPCP